MNCGWPSAPAHDDFIARGEICPRSAMSSAASTSSRNISLRVARNAFVPSTSKASCGIFALPKPDSRPQMASTIPAGTPVLRSIADSVSAYRPARLRPPVVTLRTVFSAK